MKKIMVVMVSMILVMMMACSPNEAMVKHEKKTPAVTPGSTVVAEPEVADINTMAEKSSAADASKEVAVSSEDNQAVIEGGGNKNRISVCKSGNNIRTISVIYKKPGGSTSCEVTYEKVSGVKTLWTARSDLSYCLNKAKEFIRKQEGWGWSCSAL